MNPPDPPPSSGPRRPQDPPQTPDPLDQVADDLDLPAILAQVEDRCASAAGQRALPRRPQADRAAAADEHERIWHCRRARSMAGSFHFACAADPDEVARSKVPDAVLEPEVLVAVWDGAKVAVEAQKQAKGLRPGWQRFGDEVDALPLLPAFAARCARTFDPRGAMRDDASPTLARLRARLKSLERQIQEELDRVVRSDARRYLSDAFVTRKHGRWVVPVAANHKGKIPGLVVGASGTGGTLYVEPLRVVELTNERAATESAEAEEVREILRQLTALLREDLPDALELLRALGELDSLHARAAWAEDQDAREVAFAEGPGFQMIAGRHPLLGADCVPVDLELTGGALGLVVSGANAGGKTVALKTLGALTWLAASGYQVPVAPETTLAFPPRIACVIGDEQSLSHHLSSFSSHVTHVAAVLDRAGPGDLVLLDELMSGTDPEEGAALAVEVLRALVDRGALVVTTTHYSAVKLLASENERFATAAVEFDPRALRPTFRILLGEVGPSRGFEIATRFGLAAPLVERARLRLGPERARMQSLLSEIESDRLDAAASLARAKDAEQKLIDAREQLDALRKKHREVVHREAAERAAELDAELTRLRKQVLQALEEGRVDDAAREVEATAEAREDLPAPPPCEGWESLSEGDKVTVAGYGLVGTILRLDRGRKRAVLDTGALEFEADLTRLEPLGAPAAPAPRAPAPKPVVDITSGAEAPQDTAGLKVLEVKLLGLRSDPAREELEDRLDQAVADGFDAVRVIHGFGTGALRKVVEEVARTHPLIASSRPGGEHEGGRGATLVFLR